jgi:hypothetical protein
MQLPIADKNGHKAWETGLETNKHAPQKSSCCWVKNVARMGEMQNACDILVAKYEEKIILGSPRRGSEDIRSDFI